MAGIVACFGNEASVVSDLLSGLASRGRDTATWRDGQIGLGARGGLPALHIDAGLAAAVEGVTEISRLLTGYRADGPAALVRAGDPYTIAVADPAREALLLARSGDAPTLYYAAVGGTLLAAAEPAALIAAGVPATPDPGTIRHFVETGESDHTEATFFTGIRRLLPGQVVEVTRTGRTGLRVDVTASGGGRLATAALSLVVADAVGQGRVGVLLSRAAGTDPLLAAVLAQPSAHRPVPAYRPVFGDGDLARPVARADVRTRLMPLAPERVLADIPAFLADLGEPVADLADYLVWRTARAGTGEVDILLAPGTDGPDGHLSRLADRVAARFGVGVRFASPRPDTSPAVAELVRGLRDRVYGCFLTGEFAARPWVRAGAAAARFDRFVAGRGSTGPEWFWRLFLVEQWLRVVVEGGGEPEPPAREPFSPHPGKELAVAVDGKRWLRLPVRTRMFGPGDPLTKQVAGYVADVVAEARAQPRYRDLFGKPWYVVVAEKVVAVSQRRAYPLWEIRPGRAARALARLTTRNPWGPGTPSTWTMQLAIREAGVARMLLASFAGLLGRPFGRRHWFDRVAGPRAAAVTGPRAAAVTGPVAGSATANLVATLGAADADRVAHQIDAALRLALPPRAAEQLRGCVVMAGGSVRGFSADRPGGFFAEAFADDPLGQGVERTPVGMLVTAAAVRRAKRAKPAPGRRRRSASKR